MRKKIIPIILIDSREQIPYTFSDYNIKTMCTTLKTGDYSIGLFNTKDETITRFDHLISIERKSLDNFVGDVSCDENRTRFEASVMRGSKLQFYAVFIEGTELEVLTRKYESRINPSSVLNTKIGWSVKYRVPIEFCDNRISAEYRTYHSLILFLKYQKEKEKLPSTNINILSAISI